MWDMIRDEADLGMADRIQVQREDAHGENRKAAQHVKGKLSAWERIEYLLDKGSFVEINMHVQHRCTYFGMERREYAGDGVITGIGSIGERPVCVFAQDFTVMGGSISEVNGQKVAKLYEKALAMKVPVIGLFDSGGARVQEGISALSGLGRIFYFNVQVSGIIPQIAAIMGNCAGGGAYSPALMDYMVMVKSANLFIAGPRVVKEAIGQEVSLEELGGIRVHAEESGQVDFVAEDDRECLDYIRRLIWLLPGNCDEHPSASEKYSYDSSKMTAIGAVLPQSNRHPYDIHRVVDCIIDDGSLMELKQYYAPNIVTAYARIGGHLIGIVANQPLDKAGCIDMNASDKAARFVRMCDSYNIPLLTLVDVSGFYPGKEQERGGLIRHGSKLIYAYAESRVCKITVILRKAYGGAYLAMCSKELGADIVYAWPSAEMAVMSAQAAADVLYRDISPQEKERKIEEYENLFLNPKEAMRLGYIDQVIEPGETRDSVLKALGFFAGNRENQDKKIHGNIPL